MFPEPPKGPPIDFPFTDPDGIVWVWLPSVGQWTTTEPVDTERWERVQSGLAQGTPEPETFFTSIRKGR